MTGRGSGMQSGRERQTVARFAGGTVLALTVLVGGCEGGLARLMQRDPDSVKSEVPVIDRTKEGERTREGERAAVEERIGKLEADLQGRLERASRERTEDLERFLRSQTSLTTKLDDLIAEARLTQGRIEEIGHSIAELDKRVDALGIQGGQFVRRLDGFERQISQAVSAARDATALALQANTATQQTAQEVTNALQQMADQTNAAVQQVNATTQLALTEARKAAAAKQTAQPPAHQAPGIVNLPPPISPLPPAPATTPSPPSAFPPKPAVSAANPDELYKNALNDYTRGKYDLAIDGFRTYIILYPTASLLPNAQYWLGESFYSLKNYGLAIKQFNLFLTEYPDNPKAPAAMLKQGYAYFEMGNTPKGRTALNTLIKRFPKSPEARSAKNRLSKVKRSPGSGSGAKGQSKRPS